MRPSFYSNQWTTLQKQCMTYEIYLKYLILFEIFRCFDEKPFEFSVKTDQMRMQLVNENDIPVHFSALYLFS